MGRKFCKLSCPADHTFAGQNNKPNQKFVKIACKCPKRGDKGCNWYHKRMVSNYENYTCNPIPTPPPAAEPGATGATGGANPGANDPTFIPAGTTGAPAAPAGSSAAPATTPAGTAAAGSTAAATNATNAPTAAAT